MTHKKAILAFLLLAIFVVFDGYIKIRNVVNVLPYYGHPDEKKRLNFPKKYC